MRLKPISISFFLSYFVLNSFFSTCQNGNDFVLGLDVSGFSLLYESDSLKDKHSIELAPSLGYQVMKHHYIYLTVGKSFSNFNDRELFYFGYITRRYFKKYYRLNFHVGHNLFLTNLSYLKTDEGKQELKTKGISGFTTGIEFGAHLKIYKNLGVILNTGYYYTYGRGFYRNRLLNITFQYDITTKK